MQQAVLQSVGKLNLDSACRQDVWVVATSYLLGLSIEWY